MQKYFVIDTNILLHTRFALEAFADNVVALPMTVIEELDRFKTKSDELGRNARAAIRYLDGLREEEEAYARNENREPISLVQGIPNHAGGKLMVLPETDLETPVELRVDVPDNRILRAAVHLARGGEKVILVTKDLNLRIKASMVDIEPQDWKADRVEADELYPGFRELRGAGGAIDHFYADGELSLPGLDLQPNEFVVLTAGENQSQSAIGRASGRNGIVKINKNRERAHGIAGRSAEQRMALQLLLDPAVSLVTLVGGAGTGKTLLALAAGLEAIRLDETARKGDGKLPYDYEKMLVTRPVIPMGKDIGYLPGSKDKKMAHWMQPVFDNLSFLMQTGPGGGKHAMGKAADRKVRELFDDDLVELEALTYIRGRSIAKQYIVVDEAQNLTPHEVKTIISRAGEGTKIVLTGDPSQIDNPYLDASSNGLTYTVDRMKHLDLFGHILLRRAERSPLSAAAAREL
ncbi:MAG: PhoH family protein [Planctomycetota bacterium]|jgi:PhoH-like ATPase|nr:PhoH family protein [Planctomycetota bacterium]